MKTSILTRLICCWLALVVLLGSTGFGMVDHWCQMRGHSKALLLSQKGCKTPCQADNNSPSPVVGIPVVKKMSCCKTSVSYEHLDISRFVTDSRNPATPQPAEFTSNPQFKLLLAAPFPVALTTFPSPLTDGPLHRTGRFRLISLCTWLI